MNGMGWIWAQANDFESYERTHGCRGWGWQTMQKVHRRIEERIRVMRLPKEQWGTVARAMREAAVGRGFAESADLNAEHSTGVSAFPINYDAAACRRSSAAEAYLSDEVRARQNLTVMSSASVERIWWATHEGSSPASPLPRALGVELSDGRRMRAAQEVVLCCGALFTPALLQRSGVGPSTILEACGLAHTVLDAPSIGPGLQDHPVINGRLQLRPGLRRASGERHACALARFSSPGRTNDLYFVSVEQSNDPRVVSSGSGGGGGVGFIDVMLMECFSRGDVQISSADAATPPAANTNMLSDANDCERMRYGVRTLARLLSDGAISDICDPGCAQPAMLGREVPLSPEEVLSLTDQAMDEWMRSEASDGIHLCSSCRMGKGGALDPDGRVLGLSGVRVADASVLPAVPRANTHVTALAVGEEMATRLRAQQEAGVYVCPLRCFLDRPGVCQTVAGWLFNEWPSENIAAGIANAADLARQLAAQAMVPRLELPLTLVAVRYGGELPPGGGGADGHGHQVLGTVRIDSLDLPSHDAVCAPWLAALFVPTEHRGRHVASALCVAAADHARLMRHDGRPIEQLHLWYPRAKQLKLRPLYEKLGYELVDETTFSGSSFGEEVEVMRQRL